MTPTQKFVLKCVLIGVYGLLVSLQVALPGISWDDVLQGVIAGAIGGLAYGGIGAATTLEAPGKKIV
jgi:hypothetical protein